MKRCDTVLENIITWFKYLYIFHIICAGNSLLFDTPLLKVTSVLVLILGVVAVFWRILQIKKYIQYPFIKMYIIFLALFIITCIINFKYGVTNNMKIIIWMTFQFVLLYLFDLKRDKKFVTKEFRFVILEILIITSIMNIIGIGMLFANYGFNRIISESKTFIVGVAYWGRLYGIHTDPNYGAILTTIALIISLYFFFSSQKKCIKVSMVISMLIQLMSISFSASRTGMICVIISMLLFFFLYTFNKRKKITTAIVVAIIAVAVAMGAQQGIKVGYNGYVAAVESWNHAHGSDNDKEDNKNKIEIGRQEELEGDVSNRRFDLWNNAFELFKTSPIFGISFGNNVTYAGEKLPNCYMLTNGFAVFDAFHNMFMDLLSSQGIVGTIMFLLIMISSLIYILKNYKFIKDEDILKCIALFSGCITIVASSMFVSEILYVNNETTVVFWTLWGFLMYFIYKNKESGEVNGISEEN